MVSVWDNGQGVSRENREIIFERFRQAETGLGNKPRGTGLGLAISRQIIEFFGGRIWVDDPVPGESGACFAFSVPAVVGSGHAAAAGCAQRRIGRIRMTSRTAIYGRSVAASMDAAPLILAADSPMRHALAELAARNKESVLVTAPEAAGGGEAGRLVGILTERDVVRRVALRSAGDETLADVMTMRPQRILGEDYLYHAHRHDAPQCLAPHAGGGSREPADRGAAIA